MSSSTRALAVGLTDFMSGRNPALQYQGFEVVSAFYIESKIEKSPPDRNAESIVSMSFQVKRGRSCCAVSGCSFASPRSSGEACRYRG
jgi:hypothetical protein